MSALLFPIFLEYFGMFIEYEVMIMLKNISYV